jgi:hypothetical protein
MHWYRLLVGTVAASLSGFSSAQSVKTCPLDGFDVISLAQANGFQFAPIDSDASECEMDNASIVVSAPQDRAGHCRFSLFSGQPLNPGWELWHVIIEFAPQAAQARLSALLPAGRTLTLTVPKGKTGVFTIKRVVLRGNKCSRWREAFE